MELFIPQLFIGFILGVFILGIWFIKAKPFAETWAKNKIKRLADEIARLDLNLEAAKNDAQNYFEECKKATAAIIPLQERIRFEVNQNADLGDTIIVLSNEKSELQDLRNKHYVERDILKARIARLTGPGYSKFSISKEGKVEDVER